MAVLRINKTKDYTVMSNYHFREKEMSLKAKGLLSLMLSLPDSWDYSIAGLVAICKENESSIKSTLNELKRFGYLKIIKFMPNQTKSGRIEYVYDIFEQPYKKQEVEKQEVENQPLEIQPVENQVQLSTDVLNTNELSTNNKNKRKKESTYDEIINSMIEDNDIKDLIYEFIKMRTIRKKPLTDRALKMQINKLNELSNDVEMQKKIIEKTIVKCWDEFYPYKDNDYNASNTYKKVEIVPDWLNKDVKAEPMSEEETREMEELFSEFKEDDFETQKKALQERLKNKYGPNASKRENEA